MEPPTLLFSQTDTEVDEVGGGRKSQLKICLVVLSAPLCSSTVWELSLKIFTLLYVIRYYIILSNELTAFSLSHRGGLKKENIRLLRKYSDT